MKNKKHILKAAVALVIVLALVLPSSAMFDNFEEIVNKNVDNSMNLEALDDALIDNHKETSENLDVDWWPMARHDLENTGFSTSTAPSTNNVLWSATLGSWMESTEPAVIDGRVFIPTADIFYCLDELNGSIIWEYDPPNWIYTSPAVVDDNVFFGTENGLVYCLDALDGSLVWSHMTSYGIYMSSPAVVDGMVFIGAGSLVYCLDASNGSEIWSYTTGSQVHSSPAVVDGKVFIGSYDGNIHCLNAINSSVIWIYATSDSLWSNLVVVNGKVFFGTDGTEFGENGIVYCLNMDGSLNWSYSTGDYIYCAPVVAYGRVFVSVEGGTVFCLDESDGSFIWSSVIGGLMYTSPSVADGKVYIGSDTGSTDFFCLDATDGSEIWSYNTGSGVWSSAAIADGMVFVGSYHPGRTFYCFGTAPGHDVTLASIDSPVTGPLDIITPEVSVTNVGSYDETGVSVNLQITKIGTGNVEYNNTIIITIDSEKTKSVVFPDWIPEDLGISGSITYTVTACTQMAIDDNHENDNVTKMIGLYADIDWWPMFQHDSENTGYSTSRGPETNNLLWMYDTGSYYNIRGSAPAVAEGKVYFGTDTTYPCVDGLYCIDAFDGSFLWKFTDSDIQSSPAVADGKVYFTSSGNNLYCLNAIDGSFIWSTSGSGSPTVAEGKVYTVGKCFDATDGSLIWSASTGGHGAPAVVDGKVFIGSYNGNIHCLNASDGSGIWIHSIGGVDSACSSPVIADGKVYFGSEDYNVYCLNASDGSLIWNYTTMGEVWSTPAVAYGKVFVGSLDYYMYCLDAEGNDNGTTDVIWSFETEKYGIVAGPAVADGKVYIGSWDRNMYCLDAEGNGDGTTDVIWKYATIDPLSISSAVADGRVYVNSYSGNVYCFGPLDNDLKTMSIDSPVNGPAGVFTPEATVRNIGANSEADVPVNMLIDKIIYGDPWTELVYSGAGHWEQMDYASSSNGPPGGTYSYFAQASSDDHPSDIFDVGLFTPALDLSGLSSVTLEFEMNFAKHSTDMVRINTYSGGFLEENLVTYIGDTQGHETHTFNPSGYHNPSAVHIEFHYSTSGYTDQDFLSIDDVIIAATGLSEGFEMAFPPFDKTFIPKYNQTVNIDNIAQGESKAVTFPNWISIDSGSVDYRILVFTQLSIDDDTTNDGFFEKITLDFGPSPDISNLTRTVSDPLDTDALFGWENISCNVTDVSVGVAVVKLIVTQPVVVEYPMTNIPGTDTYYYNTTFTIEGCYKYHILAGNFNDNYTESPSQQFELPANEDVDLDGQIQFMDLVAVVIMYGNTGPKGWVREDVDNDGQAQFMDLVAIVIRYGEWWNQ